MRAMILILQLLLLILPSQTKAGEPTPHSLPGCPESCHGIPIPYPFGIGPKCSMSDEFELNCSATDNGPTSWLVGDILNISVPSAQARIKIPLAYQCYNRMTKKSDYSSSMGGNLSGTPFRFNHEKNKFVVIGCNTLAFINFTDGQVINTGGCVSRCGSLDSLTNGTCSGICCCQTAIPIGTNYISLDFDERYNNFVDNFGHCGYALLMEDDVFKFNTNYITTDELTDKEMPVVLDWIAGNTTCDIAQNDKSSYACESKNSVCINSRSGPGYICNCSDGYHGNPYLEGGCQGISVSVICYIAYESL